MQQLKVVAASSTKTVLWNAWVCRISNYGDSSPTWYNLWCCGCLWSGLSSFIQILLNTLCVSWKKTYHRRRRHQNFPDDFDSICMRDDEYQTIPWLRSRFFCRGRSWNPSSCDPQVQVGVEGLCPPFHLRVREEVVCRDPEKSREFVNQCDKNRLIHNTFWSRGLPQDLIKK